MKEKFMKSKKYIILAVFLIASVLSVWLMGKVVINYNISDYLDEETETKISLAIISEEFGKTADIQVMIEDISVERAKQVRDTISDIENVLVVNFDETSENYYKDECALFVILIDADEYSNVSNDVLDDIKAALDEQFEGKINYAGSVVHNRLLRSAIKSEIVLILAISLCLVVAIMLILAKSWIEPLVLLAASGIAVLLNMGTNAIFSEISYITSAVAAILQLALSVDYSIVLLHGYRKAKESEENSEKAMRQAVLGVIKPVSASALTTMAGLLALLFMTMTIGFDIGIVLMKGILISAITSLTLLPILLLFFEKLMNKTSKKDIILGGKKLCAFALKCGKVVIPVVLALVIACGVLQFNNSYAFTETGNANRVIPATFGSNSSAIVVYPNSEDNIQKELLLAQKLQSFKSTNGKPVLKSYSGYGSTVEALYDVEMAAKKLSIAEEDVKTLFAMYHLYGDSTALKLTPLAFVEYSVHLMETDPSAASFASEGLIKTLRTLLVIDEIMSESHTAQELHTLATTGVMEEIDMSLLSIELMYGLYLYDTLEDNTLTVKEVLDYIAEYPDDNELLASFIDKETAAKIKLLSAGFALLDEVMTSKYTPDQFVELLTRVETLVGEALGQEVDFGIDVSAVRRIYFILFGSTSKAFTLDEMVASVEKKLESGNFGILEDFEFIKDYLTEENIELAKEYIAYYDEFKEVYSKISASYEYDQVIPTVLEVVKTFTGQEYDLPIKDDIVQMFYVMYFNDHDAFKDLEIQGDVFIPFVCDTYEINEIVSSQISEIQKNRLDDMCVVDAFLNDTAKYDYNDLTAKFNTLKDNIQSMTVSEEISAVTLSGVFIKYANENDIAALHAPIVATDLLNFVVDNMETNPLLASRMTEAMREKVNQTKALMGSAKDLFIGQSYSRILLSVDLPNESADTTKFVEYLSASVKEVFGNEAHIAGEMVVTYDLQKTFDKDNTIITIFTIVSIFLIVLLIFRSLSLPVVLVAIIQGAIWISMATSLISGPMFFMSYIIASCILMGATIDYGILMSSSYVEKRKTLDKKEALLYAIETAIPTVFTSGLILTICGFVVSFISSQISIATVGMLLGKGTIVSALMITLVLPAILYFFDGFILKFTMKKKK